MNVKVLNALVTHTCVQISGCPAPRNAKEAKQRNWKPSKAIIEQSQARVREAQQLGEQINAGLQAEQAIRDAENAERDKESKARLAEREPEILLEVAELQKRIQQKQEREQEQKRRRRAYRKAQKAKVTK